MTHSPFVFLQHFVTFCVLSKKANIERSISFTANTLYVIILKSPRLIRIIFLDKPLFVELSAALNNNNNTHS